MNKETVTLFRPINHKELELIKKMNYSGFPPRLPEQPFFYPVMNVEYAMQITKQWNVPAYGVGYVMKFEVEKEYLTKFKVQNVGGFMHNELWVPAEELEKFNDKIVGKVEVIKEYKKE